MGAAVAPGAGDEAMVGGEEGGNGEERASVMAAEDLTSEGERSVAAAVDVDVARARARGGSLRRTSSCGGIACDRELRRDSLGEEPSPSMMTSGGKILC